MNQMYSTRIGKRDRPPGSKYLPYCSVSRGGEGYEVLAKGGGTPVLGCLKATVTFSVSSTHINVCVEKHGMHPHPLHLNSPIREFHKHISGNRSNGIRSLLRENKITQQQNVTPVSIKPGTSAIWIFNDLLSEPLRHVLLGTTLTCLLSLHHFNHRLDHLDGTNRT